jgi:DNA-binding IscR family transcriptional regulator
MKMTSIRMREQILQKILRKILEKLVQANFIT